MDNFIIFFKRFYKALLNTFFPNICWECHKILLGDRVGYCDDCFKKVPRIKNQTHCIQCSSLYFVDRKGLCLSCRDNFHETLYFDYHLSSFSYEEEIKALILAGKFGGRRSVWTFLANEMYDLIKNSDNNSKPLIIPVPISRKRHRERGFNQAKLLATKLSALSNIPLNNNILIKIRNNQKQSQKSQLERKDNPKDCYQVVNQKEIMDKTILLLDDVFTTGSTANECSKVLKEGCAQKVIVLTVAKRDFD